MDLILTRTNVRFGSERTSRQNIRHAALDRKRTRVSQKSEETADLLKDIFPGDKQNYD
jgi:hypothetical protein